MSGARSSRVALVHDYLLVLRGAERTFAAISDLWPNSPVLTLLYDEQATAHTFASHPVITSPLQRLGARQQDFRRLLPVLSLAVRRLPVEGFTCIVSSSSAFAHGIRKPEGAKHVCYCHSPFRYAWHERSRVLRESPLALRPLLSVLLRRHRAFDRRAARAVDQFVANSELTRQRIQRFWGRESVVVHPPVDVERFNVNDAGGSSPGNADGYALFVGELVRHKRAHAAIQAAVAAGRPIKVVGDGPELPRLRHSYRGQAEFLGRVSDEELANLYARSAALIVPSVEEFGIAAVEAQAAGRPVVAVDAGGARETVIHGRTGLLVSPGDASGLARALRQDFSRFDPREICAHAQGFSREAFQTRMREIVTATCESDG